MPWNVSLASIFPCTSNTRNVLGATVAAVTVNRRPEISILVPCSTFPASKASVEDIGTTAELLDASQPCELLERLQPPEEDRGRTELEDTAASLEVATTLLDRAASELELSGSLLELRGTNSQSDGATSATHPAQL